MFFKAKKEDDHYQENANPISSNEKAESAAEAVAQTVSESIVLVHPLLGVNQETTDVEDDVSIYMADEQPSGGTFKIVSQLSLNDIIPLKKRKIQVIEERFFFAKNIQTDLTRDDIEHLFQYYKDSVKERNELMTKISSLVIDYGYFERNDKKTLFYTGLTTWTLLKNLYEMVKSFLPDHFNNKLSQFQMLALTLMKLRLNLKFVDLGYRFQVDETTASRHFHRCIFILFALFHESKLVHWPKERNNLLQNVPSYFKSTFKESITVIVDCFELFIEKCGMLKASAQSFSPYKHHTTLKYLIGISITGVIIFISIGFGGRASDKHVVNKSGFLDHLQAGDWCLADKGFLIEHEVGEKEATLILPSFVKEGKQLHPTQVEETRHIASIRIHVERVISVVRQKYNICSDVAQMTAISKQNELFDNDLYDKILFICCGLVNICPSVVKNDFEM